MGDQGAVGLRDFEQAIAEGRAPVRFAGGEAEVLKQGRDGGWRGVGPKHVAAERGETLGHGGVEQDWKGIWANLKMTYVAWQFYARATGTDSTTRNNIYNAKVSAMKQTYESVTSMDDHLQQSCAQARGNGVIVYGIAVEAPSHGQDMIRQCASSDANYFDASATTISTAFRTIATNITQLKLTQ